MQDAAHVVLGEVVGAHGTRGELRVRLLGEGAESLRRVPEVVLIAPRRAASGQASRGDLAGDAIHAVIAVRSGRRGGEARIALGGIESRDAAEAVAGLLVAADARHLEPLPDGEFYCFELVGCAVEAADGRLLGTLRAHWDTGGHGVLVVEGSQGEEVLLPAAEPLLREVDLVRRRIVIEVPEGLLDPA
jgi:16S rRNA processing protein RimM